VLYTDGLTDAYAPARIVTPADLASLLAPCAGGSAGEIAETLRRTTVAPGDDRPPRDDILIVVLRVVDAPVPAAA
jgi:serine phosphatase RsbU (regulator of sigma subunit)